MAAQFRSYGSKGSFRGNLKVSDRAAAKRDRDKEFIQELKDQNVALEDRDKTLIAALNKKYDTERSARKIVEETRRQGVEAERKQRVSNAKLAADFAEQEAGVHSSNLQALTELLPQVAESINEIQEKRKAYDAEQAFQALEKAGLTPDQYKEFKSSSLTSDQFSTSTQAWAVALREAGISWHQYNAMMQRTGGYGLGFERYDVRRIANSFSAFIAAEGNVENADGASFNDALNSTTLLNNSSRQGIIEEFVARFKKQSGLSNYSLAFREETLKGSFESQVNTYRNLATQTMLKQSRIEGEKKDRDAFKGEFDAGNIQNKYNEAGGGKQGHSFLKNYINHAAHLVKIGDIDPDDLGQLYNLKVTNANGKEGTLSELYVGLKHQLDEAVYERRAVENRRRNSNLTQTRLDRAEELEGLMDSIFKLPPSEQPAAIERILNSDKVSQFAKQNLQPLQESANKARNTEIEKYAEESRARGVPITESFIELYNPSGPLRVALLKEARENQTAGNKERLAAVKKDFNTTISKVTGKKGEFATGHEDAAEVLRLMVADYNRRIHAYRHTLSPEDAHVQARKEVLEEFKEGTDPEDPRGPYKYIPNATNPLEGRFEYVSSEATPVKPIKLAQTYKDRGEDLVHTNEGVFKRTSMARWTLPGNVQRHEWSRADQIAKLTTANDTAAMVMKKQWEASMDAPVPQWLNDTVAAQEQLIQTNYKNRKALSDALLPGQSGEIAKMSIRSNIDNADYDTLQRDIAGWSADERLNHAIAAITSFRLERHRVYGVSAEPVRTRQSFYLAVREFAPGGIIHPESDDDRYEPWVHSRTTNHGRRGMGTIDIPVEDAEQAQFVINHFKQYGYNWIWNEPGHYNHVHLELPNFSSVY